MKRAEFPPLFGTGMRCYERKASKTATRRRGFTLIELSIVVLLLSVLFTVMFGVFFGTSQIATKQSPKSRDLADAMLALEVLRSSISQTYYHPDVERIVFYGKVDDTRSDRLTFDSASPVSGTGGSSIVREVSFYLREMEQQPDPAEKRYYLMKREKEPVDKEEGKGGLHYQIAENVAFMRFKYSLNGRDWLEKWNTKQSRRIPRLVQIQLGVRIGGTVRTLETLASPGLYLN